MQAFSPKKGRATAECAKARARERETTHRAGFIGAILLVHEKGCFDHFYFAD